MIINDDESMSFVLGTLPGSVPSNHLVTFSQIT